MFDLLLGSYIVIDDDSMPEQVRQEFDAWSLVPAESDDEDDSTQRGGVWADALQAGPLLLVAFQGVVGNTAFAAFPAAARYLRRRFAEQREPLDAAGAATRARRSVVGCVAGIDPDHLDAVDVARDGEGVWTVQLHVAGVLFATVRLDATGLATQVTLR